MELILNGIVLGLYILIILVVNISNVKWCNQIMLDDTAKPKEVILVYSYTIIYLIASIVGMVIYYILLFN